LEALLNSLLKVQPLERVDQLLHQILEALEVPQPLLHKVVLVPRLNKHRAVLVVVLVLHQLLCRTWLVLRNSTSELAVGKDVEKSRHDVLLDQDRHR